MNTVDLAIVGMGLSGSRVLIELARSLLQCEPSRPPLRIAILDKLGEFGRGVPYGSATDRKCLLIETLADSRCPPFAHWLREHPHRLSALENSVHAQDRAWFKRNADRIVAGKFDDLFLPRHVFGSFIEETLAAHIDALTREGRLQIFKHVAEVQAIEPDESGTYLVTTCSELHLRARAVVLSVGSIPRRDLYGPSLDDVHRSRYLKDDEFCGSFRLEAALDRLAPQMAGDTTQIVILGAAASAIESVHTILTHPQIAPRVARVITLSRSGILPGGLRGSRISTANVSPWALHRTSAQDYVDVARAAIARGQLAIEAGNVQDVKSRGGCMEVYYVEPTGHARVCTADLVLNCSGAGDLETTPSKLLRQLSKQLELRENARGFRLRDSYMLHQWPNVYVAGPLLNQNTLDSHVESIGAVFRVGAELGPRIARALTSHGPVMVT